MTTFANRSEKLSNRLPTQSERDAANQLRLSIADTCTVKTGGASEESTQVTLPQALAEQLLELLEHIGNGNAVTCAPVPKLLTTQQAAEVLNVSRPYFIDLLKTGKIDFSKVERHRVVKAEDLFKYKATRDADRATALAELAIFDSRFI